MEFHTLCFKLLAFYISNRRHFLFEISMGNLSKFQFAFNPIQVGCKDYFVIDSGAAMKHTWYNEKYDLEKFPCTFHPIEKTLFCSKFNGNTKQFNLRAWKPRITTCGSRLHRSGSRTHDRSLACVVFFFPSIRSSLPIFEQTGDCSSLTVWRKGWLFSQLYNSFTVSFQVQWIRVGSPGSTQDLPERVFSLRDSLLCSAGKLHWTRVLVMQVRHSAGDSFNPDLLEHLPWKFR